MKPEALRRLIELDVDCDCPAKTRAARVDPQIYVICNWSNPIGERASRRALKKFGEFRLFLTRRRTACSKPDHKSTYKNKTLH